MCGVFGYIPRIPDRASSTLLRMGDALAHRGPDGRDDLCLAIGHARGLFLGHARLAILDPTPSGRQPMRDPETGNIVSFNGEIYNFRALREELKALGHPFRSQSDTEVLLKAWAEWGLECLSFLRGMFAFALWEEEAGRLTLAVDHAGMKPLYWWQGLDGTFVFASEIRALLASGLVPKRLDPVGLAGFLELGAVQAPETLIAGVRRLPPGTYLAVSARGEARGPFAWHDPPFPRMERGQKPDIERIRSFLDAAVERHLVADVPVALFLSGGMDSGAIAGLAARHRPDIQSFSAVFPDDPDPEAALARETARMHGLAHTEVPLTERDLLAAIPEALEAQDQPSYDGLNVYVIAKALAERGFKAALCGTGGDEIFGGYSTFRQLPILRRWARALPFVPGLRPYRDLASGYFLRKGLFPPEWRRALLPDIEWNGAKNRRMDILGLDPVNAVSILELRAYCANLLLRDADVMGMAHGLEIRCPLLDAVLVDYLCRIGGRWKVSRFAHKPLLAEAVKDLLPPGVTRRPKGGFVFPWGRWLRGALRPLAEESLNDGRVFAALGMDPRAVAQVWPAFMAGRLRWHHVWALVALRAWAGRYLVSFLSDGPSRQKTTQDLP